MKIRYLQFNNFHGLNNIELTFPDTKTSSAMILLGDNGCGKTTIFEVIMLIFGSLEMPSLMEDYFEFKCIYQYSQKEILFESKNQKYHMRVRNEEQKIDFESGPDDLPTLRKRISKRNVDIIPQRIVSFYSGYNDRLYDIYKKLNANYKSGIKASLNQYLKLQFDPKDEDGPVEFRFFHKRFIHCSNELSPLYLAAIWTEQNSLEYKILQEYCHIDQVESILIEMNTKDVQLNVFHLEQNMIEDRTIYWVRTILEFIDSEISELVMPEYTDDKIIINITDIDTLPKNKVSVFNFLEKLQSLYGAAIQVFFEKNHMILCCENLSEGEQQMLKNIGMLGVAKEADCFVMLDEPDSHMNPKWKYDLKQVVDEILDDAINTQAIIATHDPLVVNGIAPEFVRILKRDGEQITVQEPEVSTMGKGIDGILQSPYYGMKTTLDKETYEKTERKRKLLIKYQQRRITPEEISELVRLRDEINKLDYTRNIPTDRYYAEYLAAVDRFCDENTSNILTKEQRERQKKKLSAIIDKILRE